jgi:phage baseplate assembly protein gpV
MKNESRNMFRVGTVSSVNYPAGTVRVCFEDKDNIVTDELPLLSFEYDMPEVGQRVLCLFLGNSIAAGVCLSRYFFDGDRPVESGRDIYYKHFFKEGFLRYNRANRTLTIHAENVVVEGNTTIQGNLRVTGNINASGSIIDAGGNTNHHSH